MTYALELKDLHKSFGKTPIIRGANLAVNAGERVAVIGPNGAGKSSTFNVVSGLYRATAGTVRYGEHDLGAMRPDDIARLGIGRTFQNQGGPAGRDHWSNCFSILLAGGGVPGGRLYGSSDPRGAYPADNPLTPADIAATIYHALGIDPGITLHDPEGRTHRLCNGTAIAW